MQSKISKPALGLCVALLATTASAYEPSINQGYVDLLGRAYGFCTGQEISAERIRRTYPDLNMHMAQALVIFDIETREACTKAGEILKGAIGSRFDDFRSDLARDITSFVDENPAGREGAAAFVAEVRRRAEWNIHSPVLETLLSVAHQDSPEREMRDGHVQQFSSLGHPKSRGIEAQVKMPRSWKAAEGERPHIVQKWTSQVGFGRSVILLDIRGDDGWSPTRAELEEVALLDDPAELAADGGVLRGATAFTHEGRPGIRMEYDLPLERAGVKMQVRMSMNHVFLEGQVVGIICQAGGPSDETEQIAAEFEAISPVCFQALNSLVFPALYR